MKRILAAAALLAIATPTFAAGHLYALNSAGVKQLFSSGQFLVLVNRAGAKQDIGTLLSNGGFLKNGTVLNGLSTLGGSKFFLLSAGNAYVGSTLRSIPGLKSTPLPDLLLKLKQNDRNGNT